MQCRYCNGYTGLVTEIKSYSAAALSTHDTAIKIKELVTQNKMFGVMVVKHYLSMFVDMHWEYIMR